MQQLHFKPNCPLPIWLVYSSNSRNRGRILSNSLPWALIVSTSDKFCAIRASSFDLVSRSSFCNCASCGACTLWLACSVGWHMPATATWTHCAAPLICSIVAVCGSRGSSKQFRCSALCAFRSFSAVFNSSSSSEMVSSFPRNCDCNEVIVDTICSLDSLSMSIA